MAYAAVKSLTHTISDLLCSSHISADSPTRKSLQSALDHATSLKDALSISRYRECVTEMDELLIIEESWRLEDFIELHHDPTFDQLREDHMDSFAKTAKKMKENIMESWEQIISKKPSPEVKEEEEEEEGSSSSSMVGLSDQFLQIRDLLTDAVGSDEARFAISITGMAGIGKTMLARKQLHDPSVKKTFERRFFVRIGHDYISVVAYENDKKVIQGDYRDLDWKQVTLDRKCFIVLDDVRETCRVTSFRQLYYMIDKSKGSRILVTSRKNANIDKNHFKIRFLNEEESWELLRKKVFGEDQEEEDCPKQLVKAGKKIAEECEGLPLLINAVAPILLAKAQKNPEAWKRISEKPDLVLKEASHQISEVLLSNYHQLEEDDQNFTYTLQSIDCSFNGKP